MIDRCGNTFHFGVSTKALLTIFNDIKQIENVMMKVRFGRVLYLKTEQVDIEFNLVFELLCKPKVRKVFRIRYSDAVLNNVSFNPRSLLITSMFVRTCSTRLFSISKPMKRLW